TRRCGVAEVAGVEFSSLFHVEFPFSVAATAAGHVACDGTALPCPVVVTAGVGWITLGPRKADATVTVALLVPHIGPVGEVADRASVLGAGHVGIVAWSLSHGRLPCAGAARPRLPAGATAPGGPIRMDW